MTQGNPEVFERRKRMYIVASDLSEESRYVVEWGIGTVTVIRDSDNLLIDTVVENEGKGNSTLTCTCILLHAAVDPLIPNQADRATRLRSQQERQGLAYILVYYWQAKSLLQRMHLNVTTCCRAWHLKDLRHIPLDIVDYDEPTMLIVGSRGLGQIKGNAPSRFMVARHRLKRPLKRSAHLAKNCMHVSLAEAGIDRVAPKVDQDVAVMRDEMQHNDDRRRKEEERVVDENGEEPWERVKEMARRARGARGLRLGDNSMRA